MSSSEIRVNTIKSKSGLSTISISDTGATISGILTATNGFNLGISSAGTIITSGPVTSLNFIGAGNTFAMSGTTVDISIAGGGGGGGGESYWLSTAVGIHTLGNVGIGTTNPTSALTVSGDTLITGVTTIGGNIVLNGNVTLGDNTSDDVSVNGEFVTNLVPNATNSYDLGSSTQRWRDVFISGTVNSSTSVIVGSAVTANSSGISVAGVVTATTIDSSTFRNYAETAVDLGTLSGTAAANNIGLSTGNVFYGTLPTSGITTFTFTTGLTSGAVSFTLYLKNGASGTPTLSWPASVVFSGGTAPDRTTTANKTDIWTFSTLNNGTTWYGDIAMYNL